MGESAHSYHQGSLPRSEAQFVTTANAVASQSDVHDELISAEEIIEKKIMSREDWDVCAKAAQEIFAFGQKTAGGYRFC